MFSNGVDLHKQILILLMNNEDKGPIIMPQKKSIIIPITLHSFKSNSSTICNLMWGVFMMDVLIESE